MKQDPVDALIEQKQAARKSMLKERRRCTSKRKAAQWARWIKDGDAEIAALVSVQKQLAGLRAVKRAAAGV